MFRKNPKLDASHKTAVTLRIRRGVPEKGTQIVVNVKKEQ